jgi:hypothetical protein
MKSNQKKTKVSLHFTANYNIILFGIVSNEPDYKLSLLINKKFGTSLKTQIPLEVPDDNNNMVSFGKFSDYSGSHDTTYNLISNKSGNSFLLKKMKSYDYLFLVQDAHEDVNPILLTQKMKESGIFRAVFPIDLNEVSKKYMQYLIH